MSSIPNLYGKDNRFQYIMQIKSASYGKYIFTVWFHCMRLQGNYLSASAELLHYKSSIVKNS